MCSPPTFLFFELHTFIVKDRSRKIIKFSRQSTGMISLFLLRIKKVIWKILGVSGLSTQPLPFPSYALNSMAFHLSPGGKT